GVGAGLDIVQLARHAGEGAVADEGEVLVAAGTGVGIDPPDVDLVAIGMAEVGDDVGRGRSGAHFALAEEERVRPGAAGQRVLLRPADDLVVAVAPPDRVASGTALEPVVPAA